MCLIFKCDGETNPGPNITYQNFLTVTDKDRKNLKFVHLNFQCLRSKRSQLILLANDMGPNVILGISVNWLQNTDNKKFWNVISTSHELFWCHRSEENVKKTAGGVMLFVPWILALRERRDMNLFDKLKFDLWMSVLLISRKFLRIKC